MTVRCLLALALGVARELARDARSRGRAQQQLPTLQLDSNNSTSSYCNASNRIKCANNKSYWSKHRLCSLRPCSALPRQGRLLLLLQQVDWM